MKKLLHIITFVFYFMVILLSSIAKGQYSAESSSVEFQKPAEIPIQVTQKDILWSEDFGEGLPIDWLSINKNDFCGFTHTTDGPTGPLSAGIPPISSFTPDNGFMILDTDFCNVGNGNNYEFSDAFLQTPTIDISAFPNKELVLYFQHAFRYCCSGSESELMVELSTDSTTWQSFDVRNGLNPNSLSANPVHQLIDLTDHIAETDSIWLRFRSTGTSHYFWMIDDVMLLERQEHDPMVKNLEITPFFKQIPDGFQTPVSFLSILENPGTKTHDSLTMQVQINRFLYDSILPDPLQLLPSQSKTFHLENGYTLPSKGIYDIMINSLQLTEGDTMGYTIHEQTMEITDTIYSLTGSAYPSDTLYSVPAGDSLQVGIEYPVAIQGDLTSVSLALHPSTTAGATAQVLLYLKTTDQELSPVFTSDIFTVTEEDINDPLYGSVIWKTIFPETPINLEPGNYLASVVIPQQDFNVAIHADSLEYQQEKVWIYRNEIWENDSIAPYINLNFGNNNTACEPSYHFVIKNDVCNSSSGSAEVVALTGKGPFTYEWIDFEEYNEPILDSLSAGTYYVNITDGYGCLHEDSVKIAEEDFLVEFEKNNTVCNLGGMISVEPQNGTPPYAFSWSHDALLSSPELDDLASGNYQVTVTDALGCSALLDIVIENDNQLPASLISTPDYCDQGNGTATVDITGGAEPYSFTWTGTDQTGETVSGLTPGSYGVVVTDVSGCEFSTDFQINATQYNIPLQLESDDASCGLDNGFVNVIPMGGSAPYTFMWNTGYTSQELPGLTPDTYTVEVTDNNGCTGEQSVTIGESGTMPGFTVEVTSPEVCGEATGVITVTPVDPEADYSYFIEYLDFPQLPEEEEPTLKNDSSNPVKNDLIAGQYLLSVTDNQGGCVMDTIVNLQDGAAPVIESEVTQISCYQANDGAISINLVGASETAEFLWDDEAQSQTASLNNLSPGNYKLQVTDNGCHAYASFEIEEPGLLWATSQVEHITCANDAPAGSIHLEITGGTTPYNTVWNTGSTDPSLLDIAGGNYNVTVTDDNECTWNESFVVESSDPIVITGSSAELPTEGNNDGVLVINVTGGTGSYSYLWNTGDQTPVVTGIPVGEYSVTVTDEVGCEETETFNLTTTDLPNIQEVKWEVFPNPAYDKITLTCSVPMKEGTTIDWVNIAGKQVMSKSLSEESRNISLDITDLQSGIYFMKINTPKNQKVYKVIKR